MHCDFMTSIYSQNVRVKEFLNNFLIVFLQYTKTQSIFSAGVLGNLITYKYFRNFFPETFLKIASSEENVILHAIWLAFVFDKPITLRVTSRFPHWRHYYMRGSLHPWIKFRLGPWGEKKWRSARSNVCCSFS